MSRARKSRVPPTDAGAEALACMPKMLPRSKWVAAARNAGDWPAWGGADLGRNMVSWETGLPDTFKPGEKSAKGDGILPGTTENVRWVTKLGTFICGNPTVANEGRPRAMSTSTSTR